jgi:hypothetical protein
MIVTDFRKDLREVGHDHDGPPLGRPKSDGVPLENRLLALNWAFPVFRRLARIR